MLPGPYPRAQKMVSDAVGRRVQVRVAEAVLGARSGVVDVHERLAVRNHVDHRLEQVRKVVLHRSS